MRPPEAPITRWHGTMMPTGFFPLARPTARDAPGGAPIRSASSPYESVCPYGIRCRPAPHPLLEGGALQPQRQVEAGQFAREVRGELALGLGERAFVAVAEGFLGRPVPLAGHVEAGEDAVRGHQGEGGP
ncbi:hypothetical protein GCM10020000_15600 [Streptomyces olivoverticillatus]